MSGLLAKRLAQQVAELRSNPDNKRCFNCESLGTTYYVPQFSIFVCTSCSGIHMQFGHRVKSVTLADHKADEVEHMKEGGNQVAAYKYLARYTPDKDLRKPIDRNPQRVRIWVQTVFIDKRFYSADAPVPCRSQEGSGAVTPAAWTSPSGSLKRAGSSRESSAAPSPLPGTVSSPVPAATPTGSRGLSLPSSSSSSPPVRDMRDLLGDRATALHVGTKPPGEHANSSASTSTASSVTGLPSAAAAGAQAPPKPAPSPAFDPFAAPEAPVTTPAMQPVSAAPAVTPQKTAGFQPVAQQAATPAAGSAAPAAPAVVSNGWDAFGDTPAFAVPPGAPPAGKPAENVSAASVTTPQAATSAAADTGSQWATFGDETFGDSAFAAAPAQPAPAAASTPAAPAPAAVSTTPAHAAGATGGSTAPAAAAGTAAAGVTGSSSATTSSVTAPAAAAAAGSAPATPSGSSKGGKPPAKELAADLFADFAYPQPVVAALVSPYQQPAVGQPPQQSQLAPAAAGGWRPAQGMVGAQPQQHTPYNMMLGGTYGMPQQQQQQLMLQQQQQQQHIWQMQQQQQPGMVWHYQQQAGMGMHGAVRPQGYPQQQLPGSVPYGAVGINGLTMPGGYGAAGSMGSMHLQPPQQQQQQATPTSPSWTANTTVAGVTEENAFADLVDLKKDLPSAGAVTSPPGPQQQQQHYGMVQMLGAASPYGAPGGFVSLMAQQPYMAQPQQLQFAGMTGMYQARAPGVSSGGVAASYGMSAPAAPPTSEDSGNPFA